MKDKLLIIGASGHGKVVADIAFNMKKWKCISFLDDNRNIKSSMGFNILGSVDKVVEHIDDYDIFVAIGNNDIRNEILSQLENIGASIPIIVHPTAVIAKDVEIGIGTAVMAGAVINCSTRIGKGCIINTASTIDHDNIIGDFVHISPGAHLAGTVKIGQGSWLGIGSVISNNLTITRNCKIGAGAVVVRDIDDGGVYVGVPAKRLDKKSLEEKLHGSFI